MYTITQNRGRVGQIELDERAPLGRLGGLNDFRCPHLRPLTSSSAISLMELSIDWPMLLFNIASMHIAFGEAALVLTALRYFYRSHRVSCIAG